MSHISGFRIRIDPGWKKTKKELLRFCRTQGLPRVRFAMNLDDGAEELANLETVRRAIKKSSLPERIKIRFTWLLFYLSTQINQLLDLDPLSMDEFADEAKEAGRKSILLLLEGQSGLRFVAVRISKS